MSRKLILAALMTTLSLPVLSMAQDQPRPPRNDQGAGQNDQGGSGRRGSWDPAQMRERMLNMMKEQLGSNDEEWAVLSPKVEKVFNAQRDARAGGWGGRRGGPGGGGPGGAEQDQSPAAKAARELRETLDNKDASADTINAKLTALRDARTKAKEALTEAQKELKELLTARQEAVLVSTGLLE